MSEMEKLVGSCVSGKGVMEGLLAAVMIQYTLFISRRFKTVLIT